MRKNFSVLLLLAILVGMAGCAGMPALNNLPIGRGGLGGLIPGSSGSAADTIASISKSGSEAFKEFSDAEEILLGEQLMSAILGAAPLYDSERIQRYVNQVGRVIASRSERPNLPWRFAVLDSPLANAGAAPGGQIYITTGYLGHLIKSFCGDGQQWDMKITYTDEKEPLGTIGPISMLKAMT